MKIVCHCGQIIVDQTDEMPDKAHVIPDQVWNDLLDSLDSEVVDAVLDGTLSRDAAYMKGRELVVTSARLIWQCRSCGRLYLNDRDAKLQCYVPADEGTEREILRNGKF